MQPFPKPHAVQFGQAAGKQKGRKAKGSKPEDLRNAPQFKFPISGGKTKAKDEKVAVEAPRSKSRRKSA